MHSWSFILSLLSMLCIGIAWFLAARISKKLSPLGSTLLFQAIGVPFFLFLIPFNHVSLTQVNILGLLAVGVYETFVMLLVFRATKEGDAGIVVPVTNSYSLVTFFLGVMFLGESLTGIKLLAAGLTITGIALLSTDMSKIRKIKFKQGILWAVLAAVGGGIYFYFVTILARGSGWFYTALIIRIAISAAAFLILVLKRQVKSLQFPGTPWLWLISGAVLDVVGFSLYNFAVMTAETSKVTVIMSASSLIIVILGAVFLKERLNRFQIAGAVCVVGGLMLLQI